MPMSKAYAALLLAYEHHDPDAIAKALADIDLTEPQTAARVIQDLISMYVRSDRFSDCLRLLLSRGAVVEDSLLRAVLLDDAVMLSHQLGADPTALTHRVSVPCAFTPLQDVSLLHVAAEYCHWQVAEVLLTAGIDVNVRAMPNALSSGHSALFHTVNANANRAEPMMQRLLAAGADPGLRVDHLVWGAGCDWESTFFDLTAISYAQLGNLPQMHRDQSQIACNVKTLLRAANRVVPPMVNVPNRYLR